MNGGWRRGSLGLFNIHLRCLSGIRAPPLCKHTYVGSRRTAHTRAHNHISIRFRQTKKFTFRVGCDFFVGWLRRVARGARRNCDKVVHTSPTPLYSIFIFHLFQLNVIRRMRFTFRAHWNSAFSVSHRRSRFSATLCGAFQRHRRDAFGWTRKDADDFCANSICITAPLFGSENSVVSAIVCPHHPLPHHLWPTSTSALMNSQQLAAMFISIFRMSTKHIHIENEYPSVRRTHHARAQAHAWINWAKRTRPQLYAVYLHSFRLLNATRGTLASCVHRK